MLRSALIALAAVLVIAPAADAATVSSASGAGDRITITYSARAGEANDLTVGFAGGTVFTDPGASITARPDCTATASGAVCPADPWLIDVLLRDRDDRASIIGYPHVQNIHVSGGAGDDNATAVAVNDVTLEGDGGDDVLEGEADVLTTIDGGSGADKLTVFPFLATGHAIGGGGNDQLFFKAAGPGPSLAQLEGGSGADLLVAQPAAAPGSTLDGGSGNDVIAIDAGDPRGGTGFTVTGDAGADTIEGGPLADTIDAGPGRDVIDVRGGGADSVTCGSGNDVALHDAADSIAADCETP
jgi:Ca2+-binding RTX toxin-like protein